MSTAILMCALFFAKVIDNALSMTETILGSQNPPLSDVITDYTEELWYYTAIKIQNMIEIE